MFVLIVILKSLILLASLLLPLMLVVDRVRIFLCVCWFTCVTIDPRASFLVLWLLLAVDVRAGFIAAIITLAVDDRADFAVL